MEGDASGTGTGVYGFAATNNGVLGETLSPTNAAISALSPSDSGLAYWGTGNIWITGSSAKKTGGGSWTNPSDARIKKEVKALRWGLEELREVRPVTFKYNGLGGTSDDGREYVGVIAQELERIFPSMVTSTKAKLHKSDGADTDIRNVDPSAFTFVLINAVQQQQELIERQERRITSLERKRSGSLSASLLDSGLGTGLVLGMLPLGFIALRRRKSPKST